AAEPEGRQDSADELAEQLERSARVPRGRAPIAALVVSLCGLGGAGWWLAADGRRPPVPPGPPPVPEAEGGASRERLEGRGNPPNPAPGPSAPAAARLRVLSLEVENFRFNAPRQRSESLGLIGSSAFATHLGDEVRVTATLSEPAHCYLVAFNPDGRWQL